MVALRSLGLPLAQIASTLESPTAPGEAPTMQAIAADLEALARR